jgi:hypothetical protein
MGAGAGGGAEVVTIEGGVGRAFSGSIVVSEAGVGDVAGFEAFNTSDALTWRLACGVVSVLSGGNAELGVGADMRVSLYTGIGLCEMIFVGDTNGACMGSSMSGVEGFANATGV